MFGMERDETSAYDRLSEAMQDTYIWFRFTLSSLNLGQAAIQNLGLGLCMILAGISCANGTLSPGDFVLVNTYVIQLFQPLVVRLTFSIVRNRSTFCRYKPVVRRYTVIFTAT